MTDIEKLAAYEYALEAIARKAPHAVNREEAADMACEFHIIATKTLQKARAGNAQDAHEAEL